MKTLFLNVRQMMLWGLVLLVGALFTGTAHATEGGFSISATNETITQGTLGSSSITVTPVNGYTGNITFAVTASNPALTNGCVLFSNYANVSGVNPTTVGNLTIATQNLACPPNSIGNQIGGGTISEVRPSGFVRRGDSKSSKPMEAALGGGLLIGLLGLRSHKLRRLACLLVLIAMGGFAVGCSEPAPLLTPKGSYALTLVGTDSGATPNISASTTFTVTVQ